MNLRNQAWQRDPRSNKFSYHHFFGAIAPQLLPKTLNRPRRPIENQGNTLRCAEHASVVNAGYIRGHRFSPDRQVIVVSKIQGTPVDNGGSDPNATMKAGRDYGYVLFETAPLHLADDGVEKTGNAANWPPQLLGPQEDYDEGYVKADGPYDTFDNIRSTIFKEYKRETGLGAGVQAFGRWLKNWSLNDYTLPQEEGSLEGYHSYLFIDWEEDLDGKQYLIFQNSYGPLAGKGGCQRMERSVVNREFSKWNTSLKVPKALTKEQIALAKQESPYGVLQRLIIKIYYILSEKFGL